MRRGSRFILGFRYLRNLHTSNSTVFGCRIIRLPSSGRAGSAFVIPRESQRIFGVGGRRELVGSDGCSLRITEIIKWNLGVLFGWELLPLR
jgi:hypothetical protein